MKHPKLSRVLVICESATQFQWIEASINLGFKNVSAITQISTTSDGELSTFDCKNQSLILITEAMWPLFLQHEVALGSTEISAPILLLTENFTSPKMPLNIRMSRDTLPFSAVTINLLKHAIVSLLRDHSQTLQLTKLAHYDALTGAANRLLFEDRIREAQKRLKRFKEPFSLLYFDLDDFKPVNDTYGHDTGDELLKTFVTLIKQNVRDVDTVARLGGDEFALLLTNTKDNGLREIANKIIDVVHQPQMINGVKIQIKVSIGGITISETNHAELTIKALLKRVDIAVYEAKKIKGTNVIFSP